LRREAPKTVYAGFVTHKRVVHRVGIHQRLDMAAYHMIERYLPDSAFPALKDILHFEGYNGPDGLNVKSKGLTKLAPRTEGDEKPSHYYDPHTEAGEIPHLIETHYKALVAALKRSDMIRAAFEASWMAHYVGDGLTPAHHWPMEEKIAEAAAKASQEVRTGDTSKFTALMKKNWAIWGAKGHMTTHFNFEFGVAFALLIFPIHTEFSDAELARARTLGPVAYFKGEAREVAGLNLYERFYDQGWNADIATIIKNQLAPQAARTIGTIWLLALLEAGQQDLAQQVQALARA
jgi:hypothetical protein